MEGNRESSWRRWSRRTFIGRGIGGALAIAAGRTAPGLLAQREAREPDKSRLIVRSIRLEDFETPAALLTSWLTPNELFFVRSHVLTPRVRLQDWRLTVDGAVDRPLALTLDDLKQLPRVTAVVTLECAGNGHRMVGG